MTKEIKRTEYQISTINPHGDIDNLDFADRKKDAYLLFNEWRNKIMKKGHAIILQRIDHKAQQTRNWTSNYTLLETAGNKDALNHYKKQIITIKKELSKLEAADRLLKYLH
jgi:hypothetical protein